MVDTQDILDSDRKQSPSDDWDDVGEPSIADDDVIPVNADGIDEMPGLTAPRDWTQRPLDVPELDEAEYVKRFRDVGVDRLISTSICRWRRARGGRRRGPVDHR